MKIALAFFGIARSLNYTINSINKNLLKVFNDNNISYHIYFHTYKLNTYKNIRTNESSNYIDNTQYKLLQPHFFQIDDQDEIITKLNLTLYRDNPDPWNTNYNSVDNFILGCYSKAQLVNMIETTNIQYDYILYVRPDVNYIQKFDITFLKYANNHTICIPNFHLYGEHNFNDRFCICNMDTYQIYGNIFYLLLQLSKKMPLHSETIIGKILTSHFDIIKIPFTFLRVRINGETEINDLKVLF